MIEEVAEEELITGISTGLLCIKRKLPASIESGLIPYEFSALTLARIGSPFVNE